MDPDIQKQIDLCNISEWLNAGYGRKIVGFLCDTDKNGHRERTKGKIPMLDPFMETLSGGIELIIDGGKVVQEKIRCVETRELMDFDDFIVKHKVELINVSTDGGNADPDSPKAIWMRGKIKKHNLLVTLSLGNANGEPSDNPFYGAGMLVNGGVIENGMIRWGYYGQDQRCDFIMPTCGDTGTSFAAPSLYVLNGILRTAYPGITHDEAYEYWKSHCVAKGRDKTKYGWGMPVLGEPPKVPVIPIITSPNPDPKKEFVVAELSRANVKLLPSGEIKSVERLFYGNRNYYLLRDIDDTLGIADVDYDATNKIPIIKD